MGFWLLLSQTSINLCSNGYDSLKSETFKTEQKEEDDDDDDEEEGKMKKRKENLKACNECQSIGLAQFGLIRLGPVDPFPSIRASYKSQWTIVMIEK